MRLNTRSRVAIDAMLHIAANGAEKPLALFSIAERQNVSLSYLEQLFRLLREQGFVKSARGPGGGYTLARDLAEVSVADVVEAVDDRRRRQGKRTGRARAIIEANDFWSRLDSHLLDYLRTVSLASLMIDRVPAPALASRNRREPRTIAPVSPRDHAMACAA